MSIVKNIMSEGRKLVPLKDYNKPLLNLSEKDKNLIWQYRKFIFSEEKKLAQVQKEFNLPGQSREEQSILKRKIENIISSIADSNNIIREIKKSAYQEQLDVLA